MIPTIEKPTLNKKYLVRPTFRNPLYMQHKNKDTAISSAPYGLTFYKDYTNDNGLSSDYSIGSRLATFTASRGATTPATYVDSNGVIQLVTASNIPRFQGGYYDGTGFHVGNNGIIIESSTTNRATYSNIPNDASWTKTNITANNTDAGSSSPDGTTTSPSLTASSADGSFTKTYTTSTAIYTASVWIKRKVGTGAINFRANASDSYTDITSYVTDGWTRVFVTSSSSTNPTFDLSLHTNTDAVYIWGCQLESGPRMKSFIPSAAGTVRSRGAELLSYVNSGRNAVKETIVIQFIPSGDFSDDGVQRVLTATDTKERLFRKNNSAGSVAVNLLPNKTDNSGVQVSGTTACVSNTSYIATATMAQNPSSYAVYLNGIQEGSTGSSTWTAPVWGNNFYIGSANNNTNHIGGVIQKVAFFNRVLTSSEVSQVTNFFNTVTSPTWYDFTLDWANMDATSPANIGSIVLDGDVDPITRTTTEFTRNAAAYKFFGTNLSFDANIPTTTDADWWADYLAFFGFNCIRWHHLDNYYPNGILTDDGTTQTMNDTAFDRMDYLFSKLKTKGIYANLNMNVSRVFQEVGDSVTSGTAAYAINPYLKAITQYDARLIALQKDYMNKLLGHTNAYTSIAYKDDPAVALIEMTNENKLMIDYWTSRKLDPVNIHTTGTPFPVFYTDELTTLWNTWLDVTYVTYADVITAWGLADLTTTQTAKFDHTSELNNQVISPAEATFAFDVNHCDIIVSTPSNYYDVQYKSNTSITNGKVYRFTFVASATEARNLYLDCKDLGTAVSYHSTTQAITTTPTTYTWEFLATQTANVQVKWQMGDVVGTVTIGTATFTEEDLYYYIKAEKDLTAFTFHRPYYERLAQYPATQQADINTFMDDTIKSFYDDMRTYLTTTIGTNALITPVGGGKGYSAEADITPYADFLDAHVYFDSPSTFNENTFIMTNTRMLKDANLGMVNIHNTREEAVKTMPFTVTEYNHCFPNYYTYEGNLMMAIYGLTYDWDGLFQYGFSGDATFGKINFFDTANNPQQMLISGLSSYIFQKATNYSYTNFGDYIVFKSDQVCCALGAIANRVIDLNGYIVEPKVDGVVAIYSSTNTTFALSDKLVVLTIGRVRNTNGYWDTGYEGQAGHYHGGTIPSQLQLAQTDFIIPYSAGQKVYQLNNKGSVSTEVTQTVDGMLATFSNTGTNTPWFVIDK